MSAQRVSSSTDAWYTSVVALYLTLSGLDLVQG